MFKQLKDQWNAYVGPKDERLVAEENRLYAKLAKTLAAAADMIAVMKLVTVLMFCWMILCSVQGWNLGSWFLPVTMVGMFAPLVHLIIASVRK